MLTINADIMPGIAPAVRLTIKADNPLVTVLRSDRNGIRDVRTPTLELSDDTLIVIDYEPAYGDVTYEASTTSGTSASTSVHFPTSLPIAHLVHRPTHMITVDSITDYTHERESATTISTGILAQYPTVTYGVMRSRTITLTSIAARYDVIAAQEYIFATAGALMLRQSEHDGLDAYIAVTSTSITSSEPHGKSTLWNLTINGVEIDYPQGATQDATYNTYSDSLSIYPSYVDCATAQRTYLERVVA